uniref:Uncharacterized protein n=1 Tax=Anopheles funestus TaxID=62324 RepID=A0A182RJX2_ANOFN
NDLLSEGSEKEDSEVSGKPLTAAVRDPACETQPENPVSVCAQAKNPKADDRSQPMTRNIFGQESGASATISKLQEALEAARELHSYTKDRNNVHVPIKNMSVKILSALSCVQQELKTWKLRAEQAEKTLSETEETRGPPATPGIAPPGPFKRGNQRTPQTEEEGQKKQGDNFLKSRLVHSVSLDDVAAYTTSAAVDEEWTTVARKQQRKSIVNAEVVPVNTKRAARPRSEAIVLGVKDAASYADIRKVKADPKLKALGQCVSKIRRTQDGKMLFELKRADGVSEADYKDILQESVGESTQVKMLGNDVTVE